MVNMRTVTRTLARTAEALMADRVLIERPAEGGPVWNPDTNSYDDPEPTEVYEGRARIVPLPMTDNVAESAGQLVALSGYQVYVPREVDDVRVDDTVKFVASEDPALEGESLLVRFVGFSTHQATRKLIARYQHES